MKSNKKLLAVLSVPAITSLLAVAMSTPVKAADFDFTDTSTTPATVYSYDDYTASNAKFDSLVNAVYAHPANFLYERGGQQYQYNTLMDNYAKEKKAGVKPADAFKAAMADTKPVVKVTVASIDAVAATTVDNGTTADKLNLPTTVGVTLSDGTRDTANVTWNTSSFDGTKAGDQTVTGTLSVPTGKTWTLTDAQKTVSTTVTVKSGVPEVSSISDVNLESFTINFSQAIDDTNTLSTDTLKVYKNGSTTPEAYTTHVSADKTKVTVALAANAQQGDKLEVVVNGVKNTAGAAVSAYDKTVTTNDTLQPAFVSITATTAKNIDVVFNKPVKLTNDSKVWDNFYIDGIKTYATATVDPTTNKVSLQLASNLAAGSHTFKVTGVRDFAGFLAGDATGAFDVSVDTTAPSVKSVTAVGQNEVKVVFSEPLSSLGTVAIGDNAVKFTDANIDTKVPSYGSSDTVVKESDNVTYDFYLKSTHFLNANDILGSKVNYKGTTDVAGNQVDATNGIDFAFTAPNDSTVPTVSESVVATADTTYAKNDVKLVFSKDIDATSLDSTDFVLKKINSDGTLTAEAAPVVTPVDSKTVKLSFSGSDISAGGNFRLEYNPSGATNPIKDTSIRANQLANKVVNLTFLDVTPPTATAAVLQNGDITKKVDNKIRVSFNEAVDPASATTLGNYIFNGKTLDQYAGTTITLASDNKSVDIDIPVSSFSSSAVSLYLQVLNVKDVAGNVVSNFNKNIPLEDAAQFTAAGSSLEVTGTRTLKWTLASGKFAALDPNELVLKDTTGNIATVQVANVSLSSDGTVATLTLTTDLNGDGTFTGAFTSTTGASISETSQKLTLGTVGTVKNSVDANNQILNLSGYTTFAVDKIAPSIKQAGIQVNDEASYRPVTMSADGKTGTIDLSNLSSSETVTGLELSANEASRLTFVSPYNPKVASGAYDDLTPTLTPVANATVVKDATLAQLQDLATLDGDGDDNTLTITGMLADGAGNQSAVTLKVKVK